MFVKCKPHPLLTLFSISASGTDVSLYPDPICGVLLLGQLTVLADISQSVRLKLRFSGLSTETCSQINDTSSIPK